MSDLSRQSFAAAKVETRNLLEAVRGLMPFPAGRTVLEIGCGDGETAIALAREGASVVGVDISSENIARANGQAAAEGLAERARFVAGDYLQTPLPASDLAIAHGVLHLIPGDDQIMAQKLAGEVVPGGCLFVTLPYAGGGNGILLGVRTLLRSVRRPWLDRAILGAAKAWYRDWSAEVLRDRVEYMYLVPPRLDGPAWRSAMAHAGFEVEREWIWPRTSIAKLMHKATTYYRR